jgi:hypothetical protein
MLRIQCMSLRVHKLLPDYTRKATKLQVHLPATAGETPGLDQRAMTTGCRYGPICQAANAPIRSRTESGQESLCFRLTDGIIPRSAKSNATQENQRRTKEDVHEPSSNGRSRVLGVALRDNSIEPRTDACLQGANNAHDQTT